LAMVVQSIIRTNQMPSLSHIYYYPTNPTVEVIALRYIDQDREILVSYGDEF